MKFRWLICLVLAAASGIAEEPPPACADDATFAALDFWLGDWRVVDADGQLQGHNRIEKILDGCAVLEHWTGAGGGTGKSLFYVLGDEWRQVWVTARARATGGIKEKRQVERFDDGGIRFRGTITRADGSHYQDRTTLRPLEDGRVHQLIEVSEDSGRTWRATFDAYYERAE